MERKSVQLELKDFSPGSRTAVIAHAVYNNIDRTKDVSRKGMFTKSWSEYKGIEFLFNHVDSKPVGPVVRTFEDEQKAYTEVKFGNWTLGNDVMEMADAGVLKGASFGYVAIKSAKIEVKGQRVRELKEVIHTETSLLTVIPANPEAGVVSMTKAADRIEEMKAHVLLMEKFIRNTKASDETIQKVMADLLELKSILFDTADTPLITEPSASEAEEKSAVNEALTILNLLTLSQ